MTPERWQRIKDIFGGAQEISGEDRTAFLVRACSGDPDLLTHVERLSMSQPVK